MRVQISNHLKVRAKTIRSALNTYNAAAASLNKRKLNMGDLLNMAYLAEFDLLKDAREDIRSEPWAHPATRVLTDKYFELLRAKEEIIRLNVEWRRVRTWIKDERSLYLATVDALRSAGEDLLATALQTRWSHVEKTHRVIQFWLSKTQRLHGFSGNCARSKAKHREAGSHLLRNSVNAYDETNPGLEDGFDGDGTPEASRDDLRGGGNLLDGRIDDSGQDGDLIDSLGRMAV